jgi:hypothetical protein
MQDRHMYVCMYVYAWTRLLESSPGYGVKYPEDLGCRRHQFVLKKKISPYPLLGPMVRL